MQKSELLEKLEDADNDAEVLITVDGYRIEQMELSRCAMLEVYSVHVCPDGCHVNLNLGEVVSD